MKSKRKAQKLLKLYGKEAYNARIQYVDLMVEEKESYIARISWKHMAKRCMIISVVIILSLGLLVVTANALGIKLFNFSFFDKSDHVEIISSESETNIREKSVDYFFVEYIPEGYLLISEDEFENISRSSTYKTQDDKYLYIDQYFAEGYRTNLNNEGCKVSKRSINGMETVIYDYGRQKAYLMQNDKIVIEIKGELQSEEFEKIICGLKVKSMT